jgi:predicted acetyltransferase
MSNIRKLEEKDKEVLARRVWTNANPWDGGSEDQIQGRKGFIDAILHHLTEFNLYGAFKGDQMAGSIILTDYTLNLHSTKTLLGGLRAVTVDLLHKKEKTALDLVTFACNHYSERGACIIGLYPFRTDFYKKMGFGYGTVLKEYRVKPEHIPNYHSKTRLVYHNTEDDQQAILDCYQRYFETHHGMCSKKSHDIRTLFWPEKRIISFQKDGQVYGYVNFSIKPESHHKSSLVVHEWIYESVEALQELCTFLHSQSDQFERIVLETQEEYLPYLLSDPANGSRSSYGEEYNEFCVSSVGMMYRIINVKRYFELLKDKNFGNQTCRVKLTIQDDLLTHNHGSILVQFTDGAASIMEFGAFDVEILLGISEFSSLAMGAIDFKPLLQFGLATISDQNYLEAVQKIFHTEQKPICNTFF